MTTSVSQILNIYCIRNGLTGLKLYDSLKYFSCYKTQYDKNKLRRRTWCSTRSFSASLFCSCEGKHVL